MSELGNAALARAKKSRTGKSGGVINVWPLAPNLFGKEGLPHHSPAPKSSSSGTPAPGRDPAPTFTLTALVHIWTTSTGQTMPVILNGVRIIRAPESHNAENSKTNGTLATFDPMPAFDVRDRRNV
jgi:hypothetical protein